MSPNTIVININKLSLFFKFSFRKKYPTENSSKPIIRNPENWILVIKLKINNNGKIKNNKHETSRNIVDDWKKKNEQYLPSVIEEEGEEEDEKGDVEEAAMKEGKEAVVDSIEDARAMIRSMRMGRSTRISTSTLAKNGSNIIAQAGI